VNRRRLLLSDSVSGRKWWRGSSLQVRSGRHVGRARLSEDIGELAEGRFTRSDGIVLLLMSLYLPLWSF
jgi:hypothetical protein